MLKENKVKKSLMYVVIFLCFSLSICGCSLPEEYTAPEVIPQEFKLLSAYVELRSVTNQFGGVLRTDKYFHYSFCNDSGEIIFEEKEMYKNYSNMRYSLDFKLGDENKLIQYDDTPQTRFVFIMTEEMYNQVFTAN